MARESAKPLPDPNAQLTAWSFVLKAQGRHDESTTRKLCFEYLVARYWRPVFVLIRKMGHSEADAEDLTQGYFAVFIEKNYLDQVSRERGRLRNFICSSVKHFLSNWHDYEKAGKRHPTGKLLSLDMGADEEAGQLPIPSDTDTPEEAYHREWARAVMKHALAEMARTCSEEGRPYYWEVFRRHVSECAEFGDPSYEKTAAELKWDVDKVRRTLHQARRKFSSVVRGVLRASEQTEDDVDDELNDLRNYFDPQGR